MTIQFYFGFYGWTAIIAVTIFLNWYRITKRHMKPYYFSSNWSRGIFGAICLVLMTVDKGFDPANHFFYQLWKVAPEIVYICSSFYLFFDAGLNGLRKLRWDYQGETSGWMDSLSIAAYHIFKVVGLVALITSIIILWHQ